MNEGIMGKGKMKEKGEGRAKSIRLGLRIIIRRKFHVLILVM